jgi:hypothetical protein
MTTPEQTAGHVCEIMQTENGQWEAQCMDCPWHSVGTQGWEQTMGGALSHFRGAPTADDIAKAENQ